LLGYIVAKPLQSEFRNLGDAAEFRLIHTNTVSHVDALSICC
jgi:hypothetical protein